jgi:hypothetical protein
MVPKQRSEGTVTDELFYLGVSHRAPRILFGPSKIEYTALWYHTRMIKDN